MIEAKVSRDEVKMKEGYVKVVKKKKNKTWILLISHKSCTGSIVRESYHLTVNVSIGLTCGSEYTCNKRLTLSQLPQISNIHFPTPIKRCWKYHHL